MGTVTVAIEVGDLQGRQFREVPTEVDTGATYSAIPRAVLAPGQSGRRSFPKGEPKWR